MRTPKNIVALALMFLSALVVAQERQPLVTLEAEIEAARKMMITERKLVIAGELVLTPDESKAFWPVYNEYLEEMRAVGDDEVKLITDFADNYRDMSDELADRMLQDHLEIQSRTLKIRRSYLKKFKKVLPTIKVAKLYQVENKLDAVMDYQLASQIPMIGK
jgi:hypothetical protein